MQCGLDPASLVQYVMKHYSNHTLQKRNSKFVSRINACILLLSASTSDTHYRAWGTQWSTYAEVARGLLAASTAFNVTADYFCNAFVIQYSDNGSNKRTKEEVIIICGMIT